MLYTRDRTETVSQVWMGLTAGCAVCHDHKFDPISQREFYELSAFFNNTTQATMDGNVKDTPPTVFVPGAADQPRWQSLSTELAGVRSRVEARKQTARADFTKWLAAADPSVLEAMIPTGGLQLAAIEPSVGETLRPGKTFESADSGDFEKDHAFSFGAWIKVPKPGLFGSVIARMDDRSNYRGWDMWLEGGRIATHLVHHWPEDALKVVARGSVSPGCLDSRLRDLRRLGEGIRCEDLYQRRAAGDRCPGRWLEADDSQPGTAQGRPAAHWIAN